MTKNEKKELYKAIMRCDAKRVEQLLAKPSYSKTHTNQDSSKHFMDAMLLNLHGLKQDKKVKEKA